MRRMAAAAMLAILAASAARAGDEDAAKAPVAEADWEARDAEARWVLYSASVGTTHAATEEQWVAFLANRREWDLLEWIALTSRRIDAFFALAEADAPEWVRCAVWTLSAVDSHKQQAASSWLRARRPGLALDWLGRFPEAATGAGADLLRDLEAKKPAREDASKFLPPLEPDEVLADLRPPAHLEDLGDRPRAALGRRYVHQVERALAVLEQSDLPGEPWASRLLALIAHPQPRMRRAGSLAYAHRPPAEIPVDVLAARLDDGKESAEVRAAALLGLSYADHPSAYATLLRVATHPAHPAWRAAVSRLGDVDDGFALEVWKDIDLSHAGADAKAFLDAQAPRIRERAATGDAAAFAGRAAPMLERAAWIDLTCDPFEDAFVAWTLKAVRARRAETAVREAIEGVRTAHEPRFAARPASGPPAALLRDRVREYARALLEGDSSALRAR